MSIRIVFDISVWGILLNGFLKYSRCAGKALSNKSEDKLLVCAALLAVTRQNYVEALGEEHTSFIFQSVVESFDYLNGYGEDRDLPITIH